TVAPTVAVTIDDTALKIGDVATVTFTFSEVPSNFSATDVTYDTTSATLGTITATGNPLVFTASLTPIASITDTTNIITVGTAWQDPAGNAPAASSDSPNYTVDTVAPTVAVTIDDTALNIADVATVIFTFSKVPSNFSATDVTYDTTSATLGTITATGNPLVFTASLTPIASITDTTNIITVGTAWQDPAGNAPAASSDSPNYTVDTVAPTVTVNVVDTSLNNADPVSLVTFTFTEATSDFTIADVTAVGGAVTGLTGSGTTYQATFTATLGFTGTGSVSVTVGSYTDPAGNTGAAGSDNVAISRPNDT